MEMGAALAPAPPCSGPGPSLPQQLLPGEQKASSKPSPMSFFLPRRDLGTEMPPASGGYLVGQGKERLEWPWEATAGAGTQGRMSLWLCSHGQLFKCSPCKGWRAHSVPQDARAQGTLRENSGHLPCRVFPHIPPSDPAVSKHLSKSLA